MKKTLQFSAIAIAFVMSSAGTIAAEKIDWKACDKEVKEFKCTGDDKSVWACLEKHDEKLSKACQATHEKGDKLFKK